MIDIQGREQQPLRTILSEMFCQEEGCMKTFKSFAAFEKHLDVGKHMMKLAKQSVYDEIKRKWTEACHSVGGGYVRGQTSASSSDNQPPPRLAKWNTDGLFGEHGNQWPFWKNQRAIC